MSKKSRSPRRSGKSGKRRRSPSKSKSPSVNRTRAVCGKDANAVCYKRPNYNKSIRVLMAGNHIYRPIAALEQVEHHGIYVGDDMVVHYASPDEGWQTVLRNLGPSGEVVKTSLVEFMRGYSMNKLRIVDYSGFKTSLPETVVKRALSRVGETDYNLLTNNCSHLCHWAVTGKHRCPQVARANRALRDIADNLVPGVADYWPSVQITPLEQGSPVRVSQDISGETPSARWWKGWAPWL